MNELRIAQANLDDPTHQHAVLEMTRSYARDPMGSGGDLRDDVQRVLIQKLRAHPTTLIFLAFDQQRPVGIATCFFGFSTFAARALINIHDLHVVPEYQRRGVATRLVEAVENKARALDCCKLTLEVQEKNRPAQALYHRLGFTDGRYQPDAGGVLFRVKPL